MNKQQQQQSSSTSLFEQVTTLSSQDLKLLEQFKIDKKLYVGQDIYYASKRKQIYIGNIESDLPEGKGIFILADKFRVVIVVEAKQGQKDGIGQVYTELGTHFQVNFKKDEFDGTADLFTLEGEKICTARFLVENKVELYYPKTGEIYIGEHLFLFRNGRGKQYKGKSLTIDSVVMSGTFETDTFKKGFRKLEYYVGDVVNDKYEGYGVVYYDNQHRKKKLTGTFRDGLLEGSGTEFHPNERNEIKYEGHFLNGIYEGDGYLIELEPIRRKYKGKFKKGLLNLEVEVYDEKDRLHQKIIYRDGKVIEIREEYFHDLGMPNLNEITEEELLNGTLEVQRLEKVVLITQRSCLKFFRKLDDENPCYMMQIDPKLFTVGYQSVLNAGGSLVYDGDFKQIFPCGRGTLRYALKNQPRKYNGTFENGLFDGRGDLHFSNGQVVYSGEFKLNSFHGDGKLIVHAVYLVTNGPIEQREMIGGFYERDRYKVEVEGTFDEGKFKGGVWRFTGTSEKVLDRMMLIKVSKKTTNLYGYATTSLLGKMFEKKMLSYEGEFGSYTFNGKGLLYYKGSQSRKYEGTFKDGFFHEEGALYDQDSSEIYKGGFHMGYYHGLGKLFKGLKDGLIYHGEFQYGVIMGKGKMYQKTTKEIIQEGFFRKGELIEGLIKVYDEKLGFLRYSGGYKNSKYEGEGVLYHAKDVIKLQGIFKENELIEGMKKDFYDDGVTIEIEGPVKDGLFDGMVREYYFDGKILYEGNYEKGKRCGMGVVYHRNGQPKQSGFFKDDIFLEGEVLLYFEDNMSVKFKGHVENMYYNGYGQKFYESGGIEYEGNFKNGQYSGKGTYYYEDGIRIKFKGYSDEGRPDGEGEFFDPQQRLIYKGRMLGWKKEGYGTLYLKNGEVAQEGIFEDDKLLKGKAKIFYLGTEELKYHGEINNYVYEGKGTSYYKDGSIEYEGSWKSNCFEEFGVYFEENTKRKVYEGSFLKGKFHGQGVLYFENGEVFKGFMSANKMHGRGILYFANPDWGVKMSGTFNLDEFSEGKIQIRSEEGKLIYTGGYKHGKYQGEGKKYYPNGNLEYEGYFVDGLYNGKGKKYHDDGSLDYEGEFLHGEIHGKGVRYWKGTTQKLYEGDFKEDLPDGVGIQFYKNGKIDYKGGFSKSLFEGKGEKYNENGVIIYSGEYKNGVFHGEGQKWRKLGSLKYTGYFKNGVYDGIGTLYNRDGATPYYVGEFVGGSMEPKGKMYYVSGALHYDGFFKEGTFNGKGKVYYEEPRGKILYDGDLVNGRPEGYGEFHSKAGAVLYRGIVKKGNVNGKIVMMADEVKVLNYGNFVDGKFTS